MSKEGILCLSTEEEKTTKIHVAKSFINDLDSLAPSKTMCIAIVDVRGNQAMRMYVAGHPCICTTT